MTRSKTQTDKDKGPKATDGECVSHLELKEMMSTLTKAFESHTIDVDSSPSGSIYPSFSSFDANIANEYTEWEVPMDKIFARCRLCDRRKIKIVASTLTNDVLVWWNNLHDYEKPQTWTDLKALMRQQFVSMDDIKNNLSNCTDIMPSDKSELPLLQEDCLVVPCDKEELCDYNTIVSITQLDNKLDGVASDPINCAKIRIFNPITTVHDVLKLLSSLNTLLSFSAKLSWLSKHRNKFKWGRMTSRIYQKSATHVSWPKGLVHLELLGHPLGHRLSRGRLQFKWGRMMRTSLPYKQCMDRQHEHMHDS
jgi:hypothetical protein